MKTGVLLDTPQEVVDLINTYCEKALKLSKDCDHEKPYLVEHGRQSVTTSLSL